MPLASGIRSPHGALERRRRGSCTDAWIRSPHGAQGAVAERAKTSPLPKNEGQTSKSEEGIPPLRTVGIRDPVDAISTTLRCVFPLSPPPSPPLSTLKKRLHLCVTLGTTLVNFIIFCVLNVFIHFETPLLLCIYTHISIFHCICFSLHSDSYLMYLN